MMRSRSFIHLFFAVLASTAAAACIVRAVNPPVAAVSGLTSLAIEPPTTTITLEQTRSGLTGTVQLKASGIINGAPQDMTTHVQWATDAPGAAVSTGGLVTMAAHGTYTITASNGTVSATATVVAVVPW